MKEIEVSYYEDLLKIRKIGNVPDKRYYINFINFIIGIVTLTKEIGNNGYETISTESVKKKLSSMIKKKPMTDIDKYKNSLLEDIIANGLNDPNDDGYYYDIKENKERNGNIHAKMLDIREAISGITEEEFRVWLATLPEPSKI